MYTHTYIYILYIYIYIYIYIYMRDPKAAELVQVYRDYLRGVAAILIVQYSVYTII